MKGSNLAGVAACAVIASCMPVADASARAMWMGAQPGHFRHMHWEANHDRGTRSELGLGGVVYVPTPEATSDVQPQIVVAPVYVPVEAQPAEPVSAGPHIIYVGREKPREKTGATPQILYGDLPSRVSQGPEILYGDSWR